MLRRMTELDDTRASSDSSFAAGCVSVDDRLGGVIRRRGRRGAANHLLDTKYFALHAQLLPETALTRRCRARVKPPVYHAASWFTAIYQSVCRLALLLVTSSEIARVASMLAFACCRSGYGFVVRALHRPSRCFACIRSGTGNAAPPSWPPRSGNCRQIPVTGFIEFLFGESRASDSTRVAVNGLAPATRQDYSRYEQNGASWRTSAPSDDRDAGTSSARTSPSIRASCARRCAYNGTETPGTVVIDTANHFLYLVEAEGGAIRYGIGVARPGFAWSGRHAVYGEKEWPDWIPPDEMLRRQPCTCRTSSPAVRTIRFGARALYLGSSIYRIHGSNEPWTIGKNVSSGCIRMRNADVIDLYERVKVGTKVVVM